MWPCINNHSLKSIDRNSGCIVLLSSLFSFSQVLGSLIYLGGPEDNEKYLDHPCLPADRKVRKSGEWKLLKHP